MLTLTTRARAGRRTREDSHAMVQTLVAIGLLCLTTLALLAAPVPTGKPGNYPAWWFSRNAIAQKNPTNASPTWPTNYPTSDDYAGINQGQLKNLATAAYNELRAQAPTNVWTTPQGTNLTAMVTGWNPASGDAYAGVNLGQLKTVAKPFYDLLMQIGYTGAYPWTGVNADDYAAANIGQAKYAFSFDVTSAPLAVTGLTVTAAVNELDLAWTDPPYNPMENLTVLQSTDGGSTWTAIATLSPGATSFAATNLDPNLSYSYKISSNRNTSGGSAATSSTTPAPPISLPRYALIDLGTNMGPVAMNNSNVVVGNNPSSYTPLVWSNGTNTALSTTGFAGSEASGIDDSGHMVGTYFSSPQVVYWADKTSAPVGLGISASAFGGTYGNFSYYPFIGGDGSIVGAVGSTLTSTNLDISGGPIAATFTPGGSPAYLWVGNTWVQPTSKARGHWAGWCDISFFGGNPPDEIDGAVVDGTEYPNLYPYAVNDSGVAVGTDYTNALIIAGTGSGTTLGPGAALALNNATVMSGTNTVAQPQIIGRDASTYPGNPMLWDHTNPDGTTSSTYVGKKINSLCPTHSGWTVTGAAAINNAGCIAGSANYSGTNSAIPQGQHGCLLLPIQFTPQQVPLAGVVRASVKFGSGFQVPTIDPAHPPTITIGGQAATDVRQDDEDNHILYFTPPPSPTNAAGQFDLVISGINIPGMPWLSASPPQPMTLTNFVQYTNDPTKGVNGFSDAIGVSIDEAQSMDQKQSGAGQVFMDRIENQVNLGMSLMKQFSTTTDLSNAPFNNLISKNNSKTISALTTLGYTGSSGGGLPTGVVVLANIRKASVHDATAAQLTVSRPTSASTPLTVYYSVSGTAVSGTDYVPLSGSVVIPANQTSATITVTPLATSPISGSATVIINITPNASYPIGFYSTSTVTIYSGSLTYNGGAANVFFAASIRNHPVIMLLPFAQIPPPSLPNPTFGSSTFFADVKTWLSTTGNKVYVGSYGSSTFAVINADDFKLTTQTYGTAGKTIDNAIADNPTGKLIINGALFNWHNKEPLITTGKVYNNGTLQPTSNTGQPSEVASNLRYWFGQTTDYSAATNAGKALTYQTGGKGDPSGLRAAIGGLTSLILNGSAITPGSGPGKDTDLSVYTGMLGPIHGQGTISINRQSGMIIITSSTNKIFQSSQSIFDIQAKLLSSGVDQSLVYDGGGSIGLAVNGTVLKKGGRQTSPSAADTVTSYFIFNLATP